MRRIPEVGPDEAARLLEQGAAWLDVREVDEWRAARIAGTTHAPMARVLHDLDQLAPDAAGDVVVSCHSGARSAAVVTEMQRRGYSGARNLRGGIVAWAMAGHPVEQG